MINARTHCNQKDPLLLCMACSLWKTLFAFKFSELKLSLQDSEIFKSKVPWRYSKHIFSWNITSYPLSGSWNWACWDYCLRLICLEWHRARSTPGLCFKFYQVPNTCLWSKRDSRVSPTAPSYQQSSACLDSRLSHEGAVALCQGALTLASSPSYLWSKPDPESESYFLLKFFFAES